MTDARLNEITDLKNLTRLYLRNTKVTAVGLKEVANLKNLTDLYVNDIKVSDAGVDELRKTLPRGQGVR